MRKESPGEDDVIGGIDFSILPEPPAVSMKTHSEVELTTAQFSALLGKKVKELDSEKGSSLSRVPVERLVPVKKIEDILGQPVTIETFRDEEIIEEDMVDYNTGVERSISHLFTDGVQFPAVFSGIRVQPEFAGVVNDYLQRIKQAPVPIKQVRFVGRLESNGQKCFQLHLSDAVNGELYLTDIFLSNANVAAISENDAARLGHGVFDEIMRNVEEWASEAGYEQIGLSAAEKWNMHVFDKRGFEIDDTVFGAAARENKVGYPMTKKL